jgi:hypothetical protein
MRCDGRRQSPVRVTVVGRRREFAAFARMALSNRRSCACRRVAVRDSAVRVSRPSASRVSSVRLTSHTSRPAAVNSRTSTRTRHESEHKLEREEQAHPIGAPIIERGRVFIVGQD